MTEEATRAMLDSLILLASRAPSPHNTQPWSPHIVDSADGVPTVEVCVVPSRTLPAGDPSFRDVVLALGGWVESFAIGAAEAGYDAEVEALPQLSRLEELPLTGPADRAMPVVRVRLVPPADARAGAGSAGAQGGAARTPSPPPTCGSARCTGGGSWATPPRGTTCATSTFRHG